MNKDEFLIPNMKKRKRVCLAVFIVTCFVIAILFVVNIKMSPIDIQVEYGMDLKDVVFMSSSGQEEYLNEDCFVFYMSDTCSSCMEKLGLIDQLSDLKCFSQISLYCVWEDNIPREAQENTAVRNLSLNKRYKFCDFFPLYFCCEEGRVSFITEDCHKMIKKMTDKVGKENVKIEMFHTLLNGIEREETCVIFVTENDVNFDGCEEIKIGNHKFCNIIQVKDYCNDTGLYDEFGLYKIIFDISGYPSVIYYEGDLKVETMESLQ